MHFGKYQKVGEAANALVEMVHIKDEHCLYRLGANVNICDRSVSAVNYKPVPNCPEQMVEHKPVK